VIEVEGVATCSLSSLIEPRLEPYFQFLTIHDGEEPTAPTLTGPLARRQFMKLQRVVDHRASTVCPTSNNLGVQSCISSLEEVQLTLLFDNPRPVIAVDGSFGDHRDFMRALRAASRELDVRVVILGHALSEPTSNFLSLFPTLPMLQRIVKRAAVTIVPERESPRAVSAAEVCMFGGRILVAERDLDVDRLSACIDAPVRPQLKPAPLDATVLWQRIVAGLLRPVCLKEEKRPKFAIMSPMFPQSGGPPHSSLDMVLALTELVDVDIWTDADMLPMHRAKVRAVFRLDQSFDPTAYDAVVYVLGNHPMYGSIYGHLKAHGGALILHDAQMMDFLNHQLGRQDLLRALSNESEVPVTDKTLSMLYSNFEKLPRPFLREIVRHANPVIVHSPIAAKVIHDFYGVQTFYFPVAMPYPFKPEEIIPAVRHDAKTALGIDPTRPCIISFGEVQMLKGAKQCLYTVKELAEWGYDFQFLFVGPVDSGLRGQLVNIAAELGITDYIRLTGKVSESMYIQHLQAGDIVLQIRQMPFGQVSGALLDAVSAGMHGVSSENLAASIEAPAFIERVSDRGSPLLFAEQIAKIIDTKRYEERPAPGWVDFCQKHNFSRYAKKLVSLFIQKNTV
jgi:glycosyltransferase involved in cell wall biosynthesis